jgi:antibiotic biosynthesis monooxygenase (ABM) superfamily enzyme
LTKPPGNNLRKGDAMAVKVLITRKFKPDKVDQAHQLLMEVRSKATLHPGYISGQTLLGAEDPHKMIVVSTWANRKGWDDWKSSPDRVEMTKKMEEFLEVPEEWEIFYAGAVS